MNRLGDALDQGDVKTASRMAHSIKGTGQTYGAGEAIRAAREVELWLEAGEVENANESLDRLRAIVDQFCLSLSEFVV
jgi:HPt (histidine-containing phosphotransfer) domain-containing protein